MELEAYLLKEIQHRIPADLLNAAYGETYNLICQIEAELDEVRKITTHDIPAQLWRNTSRYVYYRIIVTMVDNLEQAKSGVAKEFYQQAMRSDYSLSIVSRRKDSANLADEELWKIKNIWRIFWRKNQWKQSKS